MRQKDRTWRRCCAKQRTRLCTKVSRQWSIPKLPSSIQGIYCTIVVFASITFAVAYAVLAQFVGSKDSLLPVLAMTAMLSTLTYNSMASARKERRDLSILLVEQWNEGQSGALWLRSAEIAIEQYHRFADVLNAAEMRLLCHSSILDSKVSKADEEMRSVAQHSTQVLNLLSFLDKWILYEDSDMLEPGFVQQAIGSADLRRLDECVQTYPICRGTSNKGKDLSTEMEQRRMNFVTKLVARVSDSEKRCLLETGLVPV